MKNYTIGEIQRKGLLINRDGTPYTTKAAVYKALKKMLVTCEKVQTPHGIGYRVPLSVIHSFNKSKIDRMR